MRMMQTLAKALAPIYPAAKRLLYRFHGGVFPRYEKEFSAKNPIRPPYLPTELILPLPQAVGEVREPLVKVGDKVLKNQLLAQSHADPETKLVVPMHAPTSGTIIAIEPRTLPHASGLEELCIVLQPDGRHEQLDNLLQTDGKWPENALSLRELLAKSGIIGMGGAGFPTYAKLPKTQGKVKQLLINGAECEPFITCDDLLMQTQAEEIWQGAQITAKALGASEILCGIESNKPQAIHAMQSAITQLQHNSGYAKMRIIEVATVYPMGGQKQLVYEMTGTELKTGRHAIDQGLLMMNVATLKAIYQAVTFGNPLTSRLVTVSGEGLQTGFNIEALIGTPFNELAALAQPKSPIDYPLIMGGPMMGVQMPSNHVPVLKTTNCILANPPEPRQMQMPCIRCGECMDACPVNLLPQQMYWHAQGHEYEKVEKLNIKDCIECGCCSYVCPSHIPLVQYYRHAKSEIKVLNAQKQAAELAKQRHEFKLARIEREKAEREARLKAKKEAVKKQAASQATNEAPATSVNPAAAAAKARAAAASRKASATTATEDVNAASSKPMSAREKAILAAQKAAANQQGQSDKDFKTKGQSLGSARDKHSAAEAAKKRAAQAAALAASKAKAAAMAKQTSKSAVQTPSNDVDTHSEQTVVLSAREKAMAAAKLKAAQAAAQKRAANDTQETMTSEPENPSSVEALTTQSYADSQAVDISAHSTSSSPALEKELARKAAVQQAREAALARKRREQNLTVETEQASNTSEEDKELTPATASSDAKQAAMEAAKRRAAAMAAKKAAQKRAAQQQNKEEES